jgi:FkbM family methyltransferase
MPMFESHAQNSEDVVLWRALGHVDCGTYVDVGAADPDEDSVTKAFYERGWSGLNVEPADEYAERLRVERPRDVTVQACAGEAPGTITLHHVLGTGLSSVLESSIDSLAATSYEVVDVEVPMERLDTIMAGAGLEGREIHFLKIDVEGFEESVLRGIDLSQWRPWVIVAEATAPRSPEQVHQLWEPLLLEFGYEFCLFDGLNRFYVAKEHPELRADLSYPASVFDQPYSTPPHAELLREYDKLLEGSEELRSVHEGALRSYDHVNAELQQSLDSYHRVDALYRSTVEEYGRLELEYRNSVEGYERLHGEYEKALAGYEYANTQLENTLQSVELLRSDHEATVSQLGQLRGEHEALAAERDRLREGIASMTVEFDGVRQARDAARRELDLTRQTLSWRITRPLRAIRGLRAR